MIIRAAKADDAEKFINMLKELDTQTKNMLFEPGERKITLEQMKEKIISMSGSDGLTLLIEEKEKIGGFLSAQRGIPNRIHHSAYIVIGMLKEYRGQNLGTKLFEKLEKWAIENNIIRLELTVVTSNEGAVKLYENMGFKIEGIKEKSMIVDREYVDEYYMAKVIGVNIK